MDPLRFAAAKVVCLAPTTSVVHSLPRIDAVDAPVPRWGMGIVVWGVPYIPRGGLPYIDNY